VTATVLETGLALHCEELHHVYSADTGDTVALDAVSLTVRAGETIAVLGPSGSGKSTLLAVVAGLLRPTSGQVYVGGDDLTLMSERELVALRAQRMGVVIQDPARNLLPYGTAEDNVRFAQRGVRGFRRATLPSPGDLLDALGLSHLRGRPVGAFSGGEQQRLAVAMGMSNTPGLLLVDEPTSQLDESNRDAVIDLIGVIGRRFGTTVVVVTHDPGVTERIGRTITITRGIATDDIQSMAQHLYVDREGRVELPEDVQRQLPPGSRARIVRRPHGVELVREELGEGGDGDRWEPDRREVRSDTDHGGTR
jgi:putative ABC transport system ATP-binding protein